MSDTLTVTVNREEHTVPNTVETVSEFFEAIGWDESTGEYNLYLLDGDEEIGPLGEMLVFDDGDEFVALPRYVDDGG
jgi:hypothetical protein